MFGVPDDELSAELPPGTLKKGMETLECPVGAGPHADIHQLFATFFPVESES
jgi:hypothetical protein